MWLMTWPAESRIGAAAIATLTVDPSLRTLRALDTGVDLAVTDAAKELGELGFPAGRLVLRLPADYLLGGPAEDPLGGGVPERDRVVEGVLDDRDRRGLDGRAQPLLARP